jgi:hypothetical protein
MAAAWDCPTCGQQHPRGCHGHVDECTVCQWRGSNNVGRPCTKCSGHVAVRPCKASPRKGTIVCGAHGGNAGQTIAKAEQRQALDRIAGEVADLLDQVDVDELHPLDGLLDVVRRTGGMCKVLEQLVRGLDLHPTVIAEVVGDGARLGGQTGERWRTMNNSVYGADSKGDGKPHVVVEMWRHWLELHAKACKLALDAGIDERRLQLAEAEVDQLFTAVTRALVTAGLDPVQQEAFTVALAGELHALEA